MRLLKDKVVEWDGLNQHFRKCLIVVFFLLNRQVLSERMGLNSKMGFSFEEMPTMKLSITKAVGLMLREVDLSWFVHSF